MTWEQIQLRISDYNFLFNIYIINDSLQIYYDNNVFKEESKVTIIFKVISLVHKSKSYQYYKFSP